MIKQEALKQLVERLENANIQYYVYGGLTVEGLRGFKSSWAQFVSLNVGILTFQPYLLKP